MSETRQSKQVIVVRKDLNMRKGKMCSQAAHASMKVLLDLMERTRDRAWDDDAQAPAAWSTRRTLSCDDGSAVADWLDGLFTKITVSVDDEDALKAVYAMALLAKLPAAVIQDAGKTEFNGVPTFTAVAIGPAWADEIDPITGKLPLL